MQTGSVVDYYDDLYGTVLKSKIAEAQDIPDFIRQAEHLTREKLAGLSDEAFAVVMVDKGRPIRKFACVDKGNTALSALYFIENHAKLPLEVQKVAAANLIEACEAYKLEVPLVLRKIAAVVKKAVLGPLVDVANLGIPSGIGYVLGKREGREMARYHEPMDRRSIAAALLVPGALGYRFGKTQGYDSIKRKHLEKDADLTGSDVMPVGGPAKEKTAAVAKSAGLPRAIRDPKSRAALTKKLWSTDFTGPDRWQEAFKIEHRGMANVVGKKAKHNTSEHAAGRYHRMLSGGTFPKEKGADLNGSDIMPMGGPAKEKTAAALYVDVTGKTAPTKMAKVAYQRYCLVKEGSAKFPIDSYGQVLDANRWFDDNGNSLHPSDRREYCVKLAARADELGIQVTDRIRKYAGQGFAPDGEVRVAVSSRMRFWSDGEPERGVLQGLMDKYAGVTPEVFCEALVQFDEAHGLNNHWDAGVIDPWYSTYGFEKKAEEWIWEQGNDRVTKEQLVKGCKESHHHMEKRFGPDVAKGLLENPTQVFDSLPLDSKRILSRICTDPQ